MRTAKTHVRKHGSEKFELLSGPEVSMPDQQKAFKAIRADQVNDKIAEVHYQESDGPLRVVRFISPAEKKRQEDAHAAAIKQAAEAVAKQEKESAAKKPADAKKTAAR